MPAEEEDSIPRRNQLAQLNAARLTCAERDLYASIRFRCSLHPRVAQKPIDIVDGLSRFHYENLDFFVAEHRARPRSAHYTAPAWASARVRPSSAASSSRSRISLIRPSSSHESGIVVSVSGMVFLRSGAARMLKVRDSVLCLPTTRPG